MAEKKVQVTIQVSTDVAHTLQQRGLPTAKTKDLLSIMDLFHVALQPMHAGTNHPSLEKYYLVEAPDPKTAQQIVDRLLQSDAVEAAYVKPPDSQP
jgi:hypothetical protein